MYDSVHPDPYCTCIFLNHTKSTLICKTLNFIPLNIC